VHPSHAQRTIVVRQLLCFAQAPRLIPLISVWLAYCCIVFKMRGAKLKRILIIDDLRDRAAWLKASLELADFDVVGVLAWEQVSEQSIQAASADVIIVDANAPGRDTLEQISLMSTTLEKPVVVLGAQKDQRSIEAAMRAGVSAYVAHTVQGEDLRGIIQVAAARFSEYKRLRDELKEAKDQLVERKLVDQAKGILIADHGYSEADAYKRMRSMAMSKGKRLVEIAEAIILAKELSA
jgi:response regulator NasT